MVSDDLPEPVLRAVRAARAGGAAGVVLVVSAPHTTDVTRAAEAGMTTKTRRGAATAAELVAAITATAVGEAHLPADLLWSLLDHAGALHHSLERPSDRTYLGRTTRTVQVLQLIAAGHDTRRIARELRCSERTVKNVVAAFVSRHELRDRAHAVV